MKHFFALPAILRTSLLLASASQNTFSPNDDLLAFPQFEVKFTESYLSELDAQSKLSSNDQLNLHTPQDSGDGLQDLPSQVQRYEGSAGEGRPEEDPKLEYEYMVLEKQRYICSIPQLQPPSPSGSGPAANDTLTKLEEQKALASATARGWELLSAMQNNCVYFVSGWWSYRFCYGHGVSQFHQLPPRPGVPVYPPVEDPSVEGYVLGSYKSLQAEDTVDHGSEDGGHEAEASGVDRALDVSEGSKASHSYSGRGELVQRGESRYLVQRLGGGTACDLTGKERRIEVQFHCNPQSSDRISLIKETSTCAYLMVIQTPRLCNDVAFLPPQKDQPNTISCSPVLEDDEVEDYEHDLKTLKRAEEQATIWDAHTEAAAALGASSGDFQAPLQIVGDIIVGGHELVPEGTKIEKGAVVGGGKETYIDTIASSDGERILGADEIEKLGLGNPEAVEKLKKELEKIAKGQQWKLDVIDTPRGREYRGIIGDEEKEGKEGKAMEGKKQKKAKKAKGQAKQGQDGEDSDDDGEAAQEGSEEEYYHEEL
ncbi:Protein OS-9 [Friedmanniomyces endolithicus]|uniref:Endoplasmic reticulum lectin n=1 Tax=Friedmanniomyces endolithicus TaxID=329885 RepID=A0AAN6KGI8_9PEZI|nr:Protein OS-9 [Friedmanniomyces endolithicus]KAK0793526.1 Protein OS-9 [Friedmanniomyces endolithicus]KAK0801506.1 Protein OS-9 [Friedmanniomyces endolithicus]KAK0815541.1 Protein OS-9 [Friedmanniomyces endolithicus]KAK0842763.1 Protein OS-9 [Friedmanniomyces endolithicus]